ncbi:amidohydrolase [Acholeplasma vituli]|uniref:Amidohydrolase n=1 Tax=Paracholeplasma vituli TaxID=69473 RepID=A0ABT2PXN7_9MOLU|nr:amidohydrolase [Paracholeplasma vituli]MCU0105720.1 amidohydrolase [Paracholeplasma vituli]
MKLFKNGVIHTLDHNRKATNILTHQGIIIGIDVNENQSFDSIIDLKGGHLYPGFVDAHLHLIGYGQYLSRIDLSSLKDKNDVLSKLKEIEITDLLMVDGYKESLGVNRYDLDNISMEKPILLRHNDFHAVTVNSVVLNQMGLNYESGILREEEASKAIKHYTSVSNETLERYLETAIENLYRYGITGGHSDDLFYFNGYEYTLNVFKNVLIHRPFRTQLLIHHEVLDDYLQNPYNEENPYLELKGVKVFYDGTLFSKTALMYKGYKNTPSKGLRITPDFIQIVKKVREHNMTLAIHVIGDQGLDELIEILTKYPAKNFLKDRIIHAPWISEYGLNKLKTIPVTLDVQPQFLYSDLPEAFHILNDPPSYIFPWKSMLKNGLTLSFSSDAPVEVPNPLIGILNATNRVAKDGICYQKEEIITRLEAIEAYTKYANAQNIKENRGVIKMGYLADFTVFKSDLESLPDEDLVKPQVQMTVIDEHIVYED